ncbi:chemotaxis-specific protein-glutamate methyltransferase CheB [Actinoplanes regularis]|uniref:Protein-glutamate methylesterase/protein-glutamine glutaminase n=1 Tax=Actinoplanes regularis TaxID=52697 RepID=A0A238YZP7_9ACTN|nr:chemotaxis-specific protein-glutamate methyltransferase CheB [Actinoplanes regularis]GIE85697.1 chemotaxis response regulator protein-glutamate methylesterase of group 3 operon [Actinoplanes regularis]SNR76625.1 two-component system, chemotaxis family, response regulator CheB [Actinoplanes regularis]
MSAPAIGVLIVDDSAVVRQHLGARLRQSGIDVIGAVAGPAFAMQHMNRVWPDVLVIDPGLDGADFLHQVMAVRATPVVLCTDSSADVARLITAGVSAVITKPRTGLKAFVEEHSAEIVRAVRAAATSARRIPRPAGHGPVPTTDRVVVLGTSTGGTKALEMVLPVLPPSTPGMVIVQHMPENFTAAFAQRLDAMCRVQVAEAVDGAEVRPGRVLIAPGGRHTELVRHGTGYRVRVFDGPPVNRHRPSVDVLFRSAARAAGASATGIIMTGMGGDGARGLLEMRQAGAFTVAQDAASCVVHGMPHEAVQLGAVLREVPLTNIAEMIRRYG